MGEERIASFDLLPSFLLWNQKQAQPEASWIVGTHAYEAGAELPELVIQSAKSWLCHKQIESDSRVLPWQSAVVPDEAKCSPIYALSLLLMHLRRCWDEHWLGQAGTLFCDQEIIITVPASFDEAAQTSVVNAAKLAGYPEHIRLLEEPHAALVAVLYDSNQHASIQERFSGGFNALVIDIGGGTTDFSLFNIQQNSSTLQSKIGFPYSLQRTAASDHILLGGDNIDLFIAHLYLAAAPLDFHPTAADWQQLRKAGALLKEQLFSSAAREINPSENSYVSISNRYGSLFANTITLSVNKAATRSAILDGFFPRTNKSDNFEPTEEIITNSGSLTEGLKVQGLPFSQESAFTRHLQFFLNYCAQAEEAHIVDVVLLTGGTLLAPEFQRRMVAELPNQVKGSQQLLVLANDQAYFSAAKAQQYLHMCDG